MYQEALLVGSLGAIINKGNIKFIPKARDLELISSWRPITLINVNYKIIAKVLDLKLRLSLPLLC